HLKRNYFRRMLESDVHAGTYTIVVAEGLVDASGANIVDDTSKADAFGHKRLAGAGKYVRQKIEERMKIDPDVKKFLQAHGMFVPGQFEYPEIREVVPGHLARSGGTSAYDVSFGKQVGAAAVILLCKGITGVTVYEVDGNEIRYMPTKQAIVRKNVDLDMVAFYEQLDICFGRKPQPYNPVFREVSDTKITRFH
ncbi:MAG: 6-phosphofructokinase, partial [Synergistales bacterium]|nr:6-phosphofructokinase [Synergistales bacterium]